MVTGRPASCVLGPEQRDAGDIRQQLPFLLHLERAALDPDHVEQVRHQPAHPLGLLDDGAGQLPAGRVVAGAALLEQRGRGALDRGERRPHVVRQRAEQRGPQPLGLDLDLGAAAPLRQRHPLERDRRLAGERLQQPAPGRIAELVPLRRADAEDADRPVGHRERHVERDGRRQGAGAVARRLPLVVGPLRHAHLPIVERIGRGLGAAAAGRSSSGSRRATSAPKVSRRFLRVAAIELLAGPGAGEVAAHGVERRGAPLPLAGGLGLAPDPRRQVAHHERDQEHDARR